MSKPDNATRDATKTKPCQNQVQMVCSAVFGMKFPEDVIAPIRVAEERLIWLEHLFSSIATSPDAGLHAKALAEMGCYVASDAAEFADCAHTEMLTAIKKGGAA